jgi:hypothetical protein
MSHARTILSHGKYMKVVNADTTGAVRKPRDNKDAFALVPLEWTADVAKALNAPDIMLVNLMLYLSWKAKGEGFLLSNETLRPYGVGRKTKYRVLACLERAGRIQVRRQNKQAPYVTLLIGVTRMEDQGKSHPADDVPFET